MSDNSTLDLIRDILYSACDVDESIAITKETRFIEDLALDSMGMLALSAELENRLERILTYSYENPPLKVGDLIALIESEKLEARHEDSL